MKTQTKLTHEEISTLRAYLSDHYEYKNSFTWSPPSNARGRRSIEFERSNTIIFNDDVYVFSQSLSCSCSNVYYTSHITVNDVKKDIRAIKNILNQLVTK
tara:strand:- start:159 stop:458 length:300 start_codon:yes stop_codon:yes gene_type:complete